MASAMSRSPSLLALLALAVPAHAAAFCTSAAFNLTNGVIANYGP